jgi:hypothetical protein
LPGSIKDVLLRGQDSVADQLAKLSATRLRDGRVDQALPDKREFKLAHGPLQAEKETVVRHARIVNPVAIYDVGSHESAKLEQVMPIATIAGEPRGFNTEYGPYCTLADAADQIPETGTIHRSTRRATEVCVNDGHISKAILTCEVD